MKKYSYEIHKFISAKVDGLTAKELAELTNQKFGTNFTESSMKSYKSNNKLKSNTKCGIKKGESKVFPGKIQEFIKSNAKGKGNADLAELVNKSFGTEYSRQQIKTYKHNHHISSGLDGRFMAGKTPPNKGKKMHVEIYEKCKNTMFKKGNTPFNSKPIGSERIETKQGYTFIKVAEPNKWRLKHVVLWEQHNGPIPKDHKLVFLDSNLGNITIENLALVSQAELLVINRSKLKSEHPEITKVAITIAKTKCAIRKVKRKDKMA